MNPNSSVLKKGLLVFTVVSILAMAVILIWTTKKDTWFRLLDFKPVWIPVLFILSVSRWVLDGMTLKCMADKQTRSTLGVRRATVIRLEGNMVANVLPVFFGIFSAHAYLLHKEKMSWSESTAVSMIRAALPVILFLGAIPVLFFMHSDPGSGKFFEKFIEVVSLPVIVIVAAIVLTLFFPRGIKKAASFLVKAFGKIRILHVDKMLGVEKRLFHEIDQFSLIIHSYLREKKRLLFSMAFWILASFLADSLIAFAILWGMGYTAPIGYALALLFLIWPIAYLAPVPGGAGVLEFSYAGFFSLYMPKDMAGLAVLLWRVFLTYLPSAAGVYYLIREFENDPKLGRLFQRKGKAPEPKMKTIRKAKSKTV